MMILVLWTSTALMSQQYHYYYRGAQVPLSLNTDYAYLLLDGIQSQAALQGMVGDAKVNVFAKYDPANSLDRMGKTSTSTRHWAEIQFAGNLSEEAYLQRLAQLKRLPGILYTGPYFSKGPDAKIGLSDLFLVKLKSVADEEILRAMAADAGAEIIGRNRYLPLWFTLTVGPKGKGNAMELANQFFESKRFTAVEPDLMVDEAECVTDTWFANQWGLENTGIWGGVIDPDINACAGWANWTTGDAGTIIAVLDHGFEMNHPDLDANVSGTGFDSESGTSPAQVLGSHGTACAGIVAAEQNNSLGVTGVAPDCAIMSVSNSLAGTPNSRQKRADGIIWAYTNGAAVISNSWGSSVSYTVIDDAITDALALGRGGLGTVIVFASGNDNGAVSYPANSNAEIIVVGAMSPCGERKTPTSCDGESWGGNFGSQLDVAAPGVKIPTTDRQGANGYNTTAGATGDYTQTFNGTSSATPHVAGLAGLIISMNPCLTQHQVADIIEKTAQKIGGYGYAVTGGRDNGTWDDEMGYGLIDIDAAMRMTRELYIKNVTITTADVYQVQGNIYAGNNVDPTQTAGDVNINSGADVDFKASTGITLDAGFHVNLGAIFDATIISTACTDWSTTARVVGPRPVAATTDAEPASEAASEMLQRQTRFAVLPNPFQQELTLQYAMAEAGNVQAKLYNSQGQLVQQLIPASKQSAGQHAQKIELNNAIPAGFYFVRLEVNGNVQTQKLLKQ